MQPRALGQSASASAACCGSALIYSLRVDSVDLRLTGAAVATLARAWMLKALTPDFRLTDAERRATQPDKQLDFLIGMFLLRPWADGGE